MKICFIGSTGHYSYALQDIKLDGDVQVVGIAPGSIGESMDLLSKELYNIGQSAKYFDDYIEMLDVLVPDIVVINCYFNDHDKVILQALKRDIHIFVEKPIATTLEDLEDIKDKYKTSKSHLSAMFGMRYTPCFFTAWKAVKEGKIGDIRLMNAQKSYRLGQRADHFKNRDTYGGTIPWVGSHAIDWLYWFSGEKVTSILASHSRKDNRGHGDLETTGLCHFTFTNDVFGSVSIDYLRPETAPSHGDDRIRVVGTKGIIEVRAGKAYLINNEIKGEHELPLLQTKGIFSDFLEQVRGDGICLISAHDSIYVTEICLKARLSADENRRIELLT